MGQTSYPRYFKYFEKFGKAINVLFSIIKIPVTIMALLAANEVSIAWIITLVTVRFIIQNVITWAIFSPNNKYPTDTGAQPPKSKLLYSLLSFAVAALIIDEIGNGLSSYGMIYALATKTHLTSLIGIDLTNILFITYTSLSIIAGACFILGALKKALEHWGYISPLPQQTEATKVTEATKATKATKVTKVTKVTEQNLIRKFKKWATNPIVIWIASLTIIGLEAFMWFKRQLGINISIGEATNHLSSLHLTAYQFDILSQINVIFSTITFSLFLIASVDRLIKNYSENYTSIYDKIAQTTDISTQYLRFFQFVLSSLSICSGLVFTISEIIISSASIPPELSIVLAIFETIVIILANYAIVCCIKNEDSRTPTPEITGKKPIASSTLAPVGVNTPPNTHTTTKPPLTPQGETIEPPPASQIAP